MYCWVDGLHFRIRFEEDRLCCLVVVGVRPDGTAELVALAHGYRESGESWAELPRELKDRGLIAPVLAVGDGAFGSRAVLRDVFPETHEQHRWVHKTANVLDALPPPRLQTRCPPPTARRRTGPMVFKLTEAARGHWRRISHRPRLVTAARAGDGFIDCQLAEREDAPKDAAVANGYAA